MHAAGLVESYMRGLGIDSRLDLMLRIDQLQNLSTKNSFKSGCDEHRIKIQTLWACLQIRLMLYFTFFPPSLYLGYIVKLDLANTVAQLNSALRFLCYLGHIQNNIVISDKYVFGLLSK